MADRPDLIEPCPIQQTFCDGLASATIDRNGNARLIFFTDQDEPFEGRSKVLTARIVIPQSALPAMVATLLAAMSPEARKFAEVSSLEVAGHA